MAKLAEKRGRGRESTSGRGFGAPKGPLWNPRAEPLVGDPQFFSFVMESEKLFSGQEKSRFMTLTSPLPHTHTHFFLNWFTQISEMIKISPKMAEFSQLAENLEPWKCTSKSSWLSRIKAKNLTLGATDFLPFFGLGFGVDVARDFFPITMVAGEATCPVVAAAPRAARALAGVFYKMQSKWLNLIGSILISKGLANQSISIKLKFHREIFNFILIDWLASPLEIKIDTIKFNHLLCIL